VIEAAFGRSLCLQHALASPDENRAQRVYASRSGVDASSQLPISPRFPRISRRYCSGWLDRAIAATTRNQDVLKKWWGNDDWRTLLGMKSFDRAQLFAGRFKSEFGYKHAHAWPIYKKEGVHPAIGYDARSLSAESTLSSAGSRSAQPGPSLLRL
jgi:hypothetical protein